jgi:hypothetical protein
LAYSHGVVRYGDATMISYATRLLKRHRTALLIAVSVAVLVGVYAVRHLYAMDARRAAAENDAAYAKFQEFVRKQQR